MESHAADGYARTHPPAESPPPETAGPGAREEKLRREPSPIKRLFKLLGPGLIAGASDDDPATVGTCASVGAAVGFTALWTMLVTIPLMTAVQYISAKIGLVSGRGLAGVVRQNYSRWVLYPVVIGLVIANTINAGADLGAIAASVNLLAPSLPVTALIIPVAGLIVALQIWGNYHLIESIFKWLVLSLLAYIAAGILSRPDWGEVLWFTFVPHVQLNREFLASLVAILGTTFAPYLYFWQSSQEVEEKVAMGRKKLWERRGTTDAELKYAAADVNVGMIASNTVTYFIILATAAALYRPGEHVAIASAQQAALALEPVAGSAAKVLLAVGLIGAGILAVPVLTTSAAYALSEAFGWRFGLDRKPTRAPQFYAVIVLSTAAAVGLNYLGINPFAALVLTSTLYGFLAPPLLVLVMLVTNNRRIMDHRVNSGWVNVLGWVSTAATFLAVAGLVWTWLW